MKEKDLIFVASAHHVLIEQGERVHGGQRFTVAADRAVELLTNPRLNIIEATDDKPAAGGATDRRSPGSDPGGADQDDEQVSGALEGGGQQSDPEEDF